MNRRPERLSDLLPGVVADLARRHGTQPPTLTNRSHNMPEETRHYIALTEMGRMVTTLGPAPAKSFTLDPREPIPLGETLAYPVSAEIAQAWTADDDVDGAA